MAQRPRRLYKPRLVQWVSRTPRTPPRSLKMPRMMTARMTRTAAGTTTMTRMMVTATRTTAMTMTMKSRLKQWSAALLKPLGHCNNNSVVRHYTGVHPPHPRFLLVLDPHQPPPPCIHVSKFYFFYFISQKMIFLFIY
jgi:hypothetical protein